MLVLVNSAVSLPLDCLPSTTPTEEEEEQESDS